MRCARGPRCLLPATAVNGSAPAQPDLFSAAPEPSPALEALSELDPDNLSPRQALDALYRLKSLEKS